MSLKVSFEAKDFHNFYFPLMEEWKKSGFHEKKNIIKRLQNRITSEVDANNFSDVSTHKFICSEYFKDLRNVYFTLVNQFIMEWGMSLTVEDIVENFIDFGLGYSKSNVLNLYDYKVFEQNEAIRFFLIKRGSHNISRFYYPLLLGVFLEIKELYEKMGEEVKEVEFFQNLINYRASHYEIEHVPVSRFLRELQFFVESLDSKYRDIMAESLSNLLSVLQDRYMEIEKEEIVRFKEEFISPMLTARILDTEELLTNLKLDPTIVLGSITVEEAVNDILSELSITHISFVKRFQSLNKEKMEIALGLYIEAIMEKLTLKGLQDSYVESVEYLLMNGGKKDVSDS